VLKYFACEAHHPEGRVQYIRFRTFDCLHTYMPCGGKKGKRKQFDADLERFL
jgi:hypothetical protein